MFWDVFHAVAEAMWHNAAAQPSRPVDPARSLEFSLHLCRRLIFISNLWILGCWWVVWEQVGNRISFTASVLSEAHFVLGGIGMLLAWRSSRWFARLGLPSSLLQAACGFLFAFQSGLPRIVGEFAVACLVSLPIVPLMNVAFGGVYVMTHLKQQKIWREISQPPDLTDY